MEKCVKTAKSLPSRERGLKSTKSFGIIRYNPVAPLAGAWIEIAVVGMNFNETTLSLPSRERGLKYKGLERAIKVLSRPPRGSVD